MNNPTVSSQQAPAYLAKAVYPASNRTDACGPVNGIRKIRNITSNAPMMQLIDLIRHQ